MADKDDFENEDLGPLNEGTGHSDDLGKRPGREYSSDSQDDDLADSIPAVSVAKKKNAMIAIGGFMLLMFVVYSLMGSGDKKASKRKTEIQQMQDENRKSAPVPRSARGEGVGNVVSPSAALPGQEGVPSMPNLASRTAQPVVQETLPPPPTLPPIYDPASIYIREGSGNSATSAPSGAGAFQQRYTQQRTRLPEVDSGFSSGRSTGMTPSLPGEFDGLDPEARATLEKDRKQRVTANMFVGGSRAGGPTRKSDGTMSSAARDSYSLSETSAGKTDVTIRRDLERVILQGKVLDAVLETAIDTDLPGSLRAIVSRDVYSESGKRIVIPKGSRLLGKYATDIKFNQARVYVAWNRVIRPDGIDAVLDGEGMAAIDALGRTGVYGDLDNRFFEIFGSSILMSAITVGFAVAADAAVGGDNTTTTTTPAGSLGSGTSTTSGNVVSQGVSRAVTDLGQDISGVAKNFFKTTPRITVDQGTRIKIFVNRDILFPPSYFESGVVNAGGVMLMN